MTKSLLPAFSAILLGACSFSALAADNKTVETIHSGQETRIQVDKKRDRLSGADKVVKPSEERTSKFFETPVETSDAPAQEQKP